MKGTLKVYHNHTNMQSNIQSNMWLHIQNGCARINGREDSDMKKNDILLAIGIFLIAGAFLLVFWKIGSLDVGNITVTMNGQLVGTYSLKQDQEIPIGETNYLVIEDGQADMIEADCPDQICVNHKSISKNGETIVCLPNKVIVEVVGGEEADMDAVMN